MDLLAGDEALMAEPLAGWTSGIVMKRNMSHQAVGFGEVPLEFFLRLNAMMSTGKYTVLKRQISILCKTRSNKLLGKSC